MEFRRQDREIPDSNQYERDRTDRMLQELADNKSIPEKNKKELAKYLDFLHANPNLTMRTITLRVYTLKHFLEELGDVDVNKVTKEDIIRVTAKINQLKVSEKVGRKLITKNKTSRRISRDLSGRTKVEILSNMKTFYKHLLGEDLYYPPIIAWLKPKKERHKILKEDLLTEDDIIAMIRHAKTPRDKAVIAVTYETGCRCGELIGIKLKDISFETRPVHIKLDGKTGPRSVGIVTSVPYLKTYLNSRTDIKSNDLIWRSEGLYSIPEDRLTPVDAPIGYDTISYILKYTARKAGIRKKCNPHWLRHSRITYCATKMTESQLKSYFGWTPGSAMAETYVHLAKDGSDTDNSVLEMSGEDVNKELLISKLKTRTCSVCGTANGVEVEFCSKCKSPMNVIVEVQTESKLEELEERLNKMSELLAYKVKDEVDAESVREIASMNKIKYDEDQKELEKMAKSGGLKVTIKEAKKVRAKIRKRLSDGHAN